MGHLMKYKMAINVETIKEPEAWSFVKVILRGTPNNRVHKVKLKHLSTA